MSSSPASQLRPISPFSHQPGLGTMLGLPASPAFSSLTPYFFFFFFFFPVTAVLAGEPAVWNTSIPQCYSFHCGDKVEIRYPLWNASEAKSCYCGYPNMGIECRDGHSVLKLGDDSYRVANVSYSTSTILLQDMDLLNLDCPRARHNLTLVEGVPLLPTTADAYLLFFFNCSDSVNFLSLGWTQLPCLNPDGDNVSFVSLQRRNVDEPTYSSWWGVCQDYVVSPVLRTVIEPNRSRLESAFGDALGMGFQLRWEAPNMADCRRCEKTGGNCGYTHNKDVGGYDFLCFCKDGEHAGNCASSGNRKKYKIIVGVCAGAGGFLLASLCFFLYRRRKMATRSGSSTLLFGSTSSGLSTKKDPEMGSVHYPTPHFSYEELHEATDGFSASNELGDGGFGTVYKGKLRDGRIVAVKRLYESNYKRVEQFKNEVDILNLLRHQNLVTLYGCTSRHCRELLLVYEYVPNGTVADHLHGHRAEEGPLTWPVRLNIAVETATALAYLHAVDPQIIHRDVKTNNILLDNNFHVKVADFGLSRLFPADVTHVSTAPQGTPGYVDPEYHQCYQLTDKSDVYSFGVVLVELLSSKPAVDITRHRHEINLANLAINKIQNGALHEMVDPALKFETEWEVRRMIKLVAELAFRCLQAEKEMRPSMEDVVEVLRGIQRQDEAGRMAGADDGAADDATLLKTHPPVSPDTVMDKWASRTTTPNTSA